MSWWSKMQLYQEILSNQDLIYNCLKLKEDYERKKITLHEAKTIVIEIRSIMKTYNPFNKPIPFFQQEKFQNTHKKHVLPTLELIEDLVE